MKLKARLMICTAALALSATMARAAIDPNALAESYLADDYTYVEVKAGPTQTKVEAVKGDMVVEVVYDNETGAILSSETQTGDDDYLGLTGVEIETVDDDFEDVDDDIEDDDIEDDDIEDDDDESEENENDDDKGEGEGEGEGEGDD